MKLHTYSYTELQKDSSHFLLRCPEKLHESLCCKSSVNWFFTL